MSTQAGRNPPTRSIRWRLPPWPRGASTSAASSHRRWVDDELRAADVIVTMGCGDECPFYPGKRYLDWELDRPGGQATRRGPPDPRRDRTPRWRAAPRAGRADPDRDQDFDQQTRDHDDGRGGRRPRVRASCPTVGGIGGHRVLAPVRRRRVPRRRASARRIDGGAARRLARADRESVVDDRRSIPHTVRRHRLPVVHGRCPGPGRCHGGPLPVHRLSGQRVALRGHALGVSRRYRDRHRRQSIRRAPPLSAANIESARELAYAFLFVLASRQRAWS